MTSTQRLWLNGFTTMSEVLANDRLAVEEVRQALENDAVFGPGLARALEGRPRGGHPGGLRGLSGPQRLFLEPRVETGRSPHLQGEGLERHERRA